MKKIPIILDTDPGTDIDDLYALAVALFHPQLELKGVTTVFSDTQARARLAAKMLRLAGHASIPVAAGIRVPLTRYARHELALDFDNFLNHTQFVKPTDPEYQQEYPDATQFILDMLKQTTEPVGLIGIGPWTNLAQVLLMATPQQKQKIRFIALMGGEVEEMRSEHNVDSDPEAAEIVLNSGLPVFMGTFHVTRQIIFTFNEIETLLRTSQTPFNQGLLETTLMWKPQPHNKVGPILYDIVPVFWSVHPEWIKTRTATVHVELQGQRTRGYTVASPLKKAPGVQISTEINPGRFKIALLELLGIQASAF